MRCLMLAMLTLAVATGVAAAEPARNWRSIDADAQGGIFFDPGSRTVSSSGAARGVFAIAWKAPDDAVYPDFRIKNVSVVVEAWEADCAANRMTLQSRDYYGERGDLLQQVKLGPAAVATPKPGSQGWELLNLLCDRPQTLGAVVPGGPATLVEFVRRAKVATKPVESFVYVINATGHPLKLTIDGEAMRELPNYAGVVRAIEAGRHAMGGEVADAPRTDLTVELAASELFADPNSNHRFWCYLVGQRKTGELAFLPADRDKCGALFTQATGQKP